jgi:SAM-dependent methyltransferase
VTTPSGDASPVRDDFDRIAQALDAAGLADELRPPERAILDLLPHDCGRVLEVGCGHGALTRHVARRARSVLALDLSPAMIDLARRRSAHPNVEYQVADVASTSLPGAAFDVVLSVATLHHLPLAPTVRRLAEAVRPGGLLLVQDLVSRPGLRHLPANVLGWLARGLRGARGRRQGAGARALDALYAEHGRGESYPTPAEAARAWAELLPGVRVVHHLEWRYTAIWRRPPAPGPAEGIRPTT